MSSPDKIEDVRITCEVRVDYKVNSWDWKAISTAKVEESGVELAKNLKEELCRIVLDAQDRSLRKLDITLNIRTLEKKLELITQEEPQ